jgi:anti-sigma regulatory factor (Ser/Thr protein kinase)
MQYIGDRPKITPRIIVPAPLRELGENLLELWGKESVAFATNEEMFCDMLYSRVGNAWLGDFAFLESMHAKLCKEVRDFPLVLLRTVKNPLSAKALNKWTPCAFMDLPMRVDEAKEAYDKLSHTLHVKEGLELLDTLQSNMKQGESKKVILDMERAFDKEIYIIRNDLYYQEMDYSHDQNVVVRFDMVYKPMELLSGDSYSVRVVDGNKTLFFLLDAMSKGIAAALTATTSTSVLNHIVDRQIKEGNFSLKGFVEEYLQYVKKELMEDEIISAFFVLLELEEGKMEYASFGMPPFIAANSNHIEQIRGNNMPISPYIENFRTSTYELNGIHRLLAYSDGLCESELSNGSIYKGLLGEDFMRSSNISSFMKTVGERIGKGSDDIALFYVQGVDKSKGKKKTFTLQSTRDGIEEGLLQVKPFLAPYNASSKMIAQITLALSELLTNAFEHGSFGIDRNEKHRLISQNAFEDVLIDLENEFGKLPIKLELHVYSQNGEDIFEATVEDTGKGFDPVLLKSAVVNPATFNGRGFLIVKKLVDRFYFNQKGNRITIVRAIDVKPNPKKG